MTRTDLTVLVIGYVWPEPNSSAAGGHMLSLLRLFRAQGWPVTFASPAQPSAHMHDLAAEGIASCAIKVNDSGFDRFVSELNPTIVVFDRFLMEEQFGWRVSKGCPTALRILETVDLHCLRSAREVAHKERRALTRDDLFSDTAKREIASIYRSDVSLMTSSMEVALLGSQFAVGEHLLHHLPFMLDPGQLAATSKAFADREHFVVIGNFRHAPNWDSVLYLQEIWPLIRKQLPQAELHIYGSYPPPKATALHNPKTGFLIKGWAEDALAVIGDARVLLAPLRFGAGIKGKLLDAMQSATPNVTTDLGAEGMADGHLLPQQWPGAIANDVDAFANAAVGLYRDQAQWQRASDLARPLLAANYDAHRLGTALLARIDALLATLPQHRLQNFTGAMLAHHTMMSTHYMSQWIEEKNK